MGAQRNLARPYPASRGLDWRLLGACAVLSACAISGSASNGDKFQLSFVAGSRDSAGHFIGGTEVRFLTGHAGKLYAGNGYWEDTMPTRLRRTIPDGFSAQASARHS